MAINIVSSKYLIAFAFKYWVNERMLLSIKRFFKSKFFMDIVQVTSLLYMCVCARAHAHARVHVCVNFVCISFKYLFFGHFTEIFYLLSPFPNLVSGFLFTLFFNSFWYLPYWLILFWLLKWFFFLVYA